MSPTRFIRKTHPGWGWLCIAIGLYAISVALGIIKPDDSAVHAPMWVIAICGVIFLISGIMVLIGQRSRVNSLCAAILCGCFALVGAWASLFPPPEGFSGGIPLLSKSANTIIARCLFGSGAVLSSILSIYALRRFLRLRKLTKLP